MRSSLNGNLEIVEIKVINEIFRIALKERLFIDEAES